VSTTSTHANGKGTAARTISLLQTAYRMEIETVANYLANSVHLDGVSAEEVKRSLSEDVTEELGHATRLAQRIKQLGGRVPGSRELEFDQDSLRPPDSTIDVKSVVEGVIDAEEAAIAHYRQIISECIDSDPVTADLATELLADEEAHRTLFAGFRAELCQVE
jgi:bacterioferritin